MRHLLMVLFVALGVSLLGATSYADNHGHRGHHDSYRHHDWDHHRHSYVGFNFSVWPDSYYYRSYYYPTVYYPPVTRVVVSQPVYQVAPPVSTVSGDIDAFTVNIPNDQGAYTAVIIKKSGNGFVGPQGEFYPEFPKVAQLKVIYGK